jgi:hypothetical protein
MGFVIIGPTFGCLAIAYAIGLSGHIVKEAILLTDTRPFGRCSDSRRRNYMIAVGQNTIATGEKFKKPKK